MYTHVIPVYIHTCHTYVHTRSHTSVPTYYISYLCTYYMSYLCTYYMSYLHIKENTLDSEMAFTGLDFPVDLSSKLGQLLEDLVRLLRVLRPDVLHQIAPKAETSCFVMTGLHETIQLSRTTKLGSYSRKIIRFKSESNLGTNNCRNFKIPAGHVCWIRTWSCSRIPGTSGS
jgi:hypothetical protein